VFRHNDLPGSLAAEGNPHAPDVLEFVTSSSPGARF